MPPQTCHICACSLSPKHTNTCQHTLLVRMCNSYWSFSEYLKGAVRYPSISRSWGTWGRNGSRMWILSNSCSRYVWVVSVFSCKRKSEVRRWGRDEVRWGEGEEWGEEWGGEEWEGKEWGGERSGGVRRERWGGRDEEGEEWGKGRYQGRGGGRWQGLKMAEIWKLEWNKRGGEVRRK